MSFLEHTYEWPRSRSLRVAKDRGLSQTRSPSRGSSGRQRHEVQARRRVFGARTGSMAKYVTASADRAIVRKPANMTSSKRPRFRSPPSRHAKGCGTRDGAAGPGALSTARGRASARSPCRSRKRSAPISHRLHEGELHRNVGALKLLSRQRLLGAMRCCGPK